MFSKQLLISFHSGRFEAFELTRCLECLHSAGVHYPSQWELAALTNQGSVVTLLQLKKWFIRFQFRRVYIWNPASQKRGIVLYEYKTLTATSKCGCSKCSHGFWKIISDELSKKILSLTRSFDAKNTMFCHIFSGRNPLHTKIHTMFSNVMLKSL